MKLPKGILDFFRFLSGPAPQMQAQGQLKPIKVRKDNPVAAKRRHLQQKRLEREGGWEETKLFQD